MRIGVVVGRFQVPELHDGHKHLLKFVAEKSDAVLVFVGCSAVKQPSKKNPLPFDYISQNISNYMVGLQKLVPTVIEKITDCPTDEMWSKTLDGLVKDCLLTVKHDNDVAGVVTLYGSRDSFIPYYTGVYTVEYVDEVFNVTGNDVRKTVQLGYTPEFGSGMIHALNQRFPTVYPTVDIAVLDHRWWTDFGILLGRKKNDPVGVWRLPGGFVDPTDNSFEDAAKRELSEEVQNIETDMWEHIGTLKVDDWRYKNEVDKIITTIYTTRYLGGNNDIKAGDDLEEVKWFSLFYSDERLINPVHLNIFRMVRDKILRQPKERRRNDKLIATHG